MSSWVKLTTPSLPQPWREMSYDQIMARSEGELINDGRSSRVFRFDDDDVCFLKRYNYRKIHFHHCWQKSQVRREYENLGKIRAANLGCETIEILAYGEKRHGICLNNCFILSRAVTDGESLALFLSKKPTHPQRQAVVTELLRLGQEIIKSGLAITDLFFRNLVVVPDSATLFMLDVQRCDRNQRRARQKSYPQFWSNIMLFCTQAEQQTAAETLKPCLPYSISELNLRARRFFAKEKKRRDEELAFNH